MGTVNIEFQLQELKEKERSRDPWLVVFRFQIYGMKCQSCLSWGFPEIYDSQLEKIEDQFCKIIADILNKVPPKRKPRNKKPIDVPDLELHLSSLC